jgi:hypothetical protein
MQQVREPAKKKQKIYLKSGEEFTPALEEELVAEAERGYDLSKARWRIRTRPLLPDSPTRPKITCDLSQAEFNALRERAEAEGCPISDIAREAFRRYMDADS